MTNADQFRKIREVSVAQIAQSVEQRTENPRVTGSIPVLGTCASSRVVLRLLAKEKVAGPIPVSRSKF